METKMKPLEELTMRLVIKYLLQNGHTAIAKKMMGEIKNYKLKEPLPKFTLQDAVEHHQKTIINQIVHTHLVNAGHKRLAKKFEKSCDVGQWTHVPTIQELVQFQEKQVIQSSQSECKIEVPDPSGNDDTKNEVFVDVKECFKEEIEVQPIRRSRRLQETKNTSATVDQRLKDIANDDSNLPLKVVNIPGKNRGVVTTKKLNKGDFVVEYAGDLIRQRTAVERENKYAMDISKGCYMYYFKMDGQRYCIDATDETGRLGRFVNHSRLHPNCITKVIMVDKSPRLVLLAKNDIEPGTELLYDYGDRSKESLAAHPWLAK